ncbi:MAG TPA: hypothetical protein VIG40_02910 [Tissierellaceae bacterium]
MNISLYKIKEVEVVCFILNDTYNYTIWYSDDFSNRFVLDNHRLLVYKTKEEVEDYINEHIPYIDEEEIDFSIFNLDEYSKFNEDDINCESSEILDFFNIVMDITNTLNINYIAEEDKDLVERIYNKLFYNNEIISSDNITLSIGNKFNLNFEEEVMLKKLIKRGLEITIDLLS